MTPENIRENIKDIQKNIAGRATLLAATKTIPVDIINSTYAMGIRVIGENRADELLKKLPFLDKRFEIHFIGRLQRNKAKLVVGNVKLIHSLDSLRLAAEIEKCAAKRGITQDCLVEVNLGDEETKGGIDIESLDGFLGNLGQFSHIKTRGLMGVLPKTKDKAKNIKLFTKLARKFVDIGAGNVDNSSMGQSDMEILSLGMSADYKEAVECGSNLVRVGEEIFGKREIL